MKRFAPIPLILAAIAAAFANAPAAPALVSPASGSSLSPMEATLVWELPPGATHVQLEVSPARGDGPGVDLVLGPVSSFQPPPPPRWYGLLPDMTYSWRVRASSGDGSWSPWSETWTFKTPIASGRTISPREPTDTGPFAGELAWQDVDPSVWYYEIQLSRDANFGPTAPLYWEIRHGGTTNRTYQPPALDPSATYYWRVRPRVQGDGKPADWSSAARFTTSGHKRITLADNGTTVNIKVGDMLEVDLGTEYQWGLTQDDPQLLKPLPTLGLRAMPAMFSAERTGQTRLQATGELPCHRAQPPCLAPTRHFEVQVRVGARQVREPAPIESAAVRAEGGAYVVDVVQGLPSGCAEPDGHSVIRESATTIKVMVFNRVPADANVACTMIYGMYRSTIPLGRDFTVGMTYTVLVNDRTALFTAS